MRSIFDVDDEFRGELGEQLALTVTCPNPQCAAAPRRSTRAASRTRTGSVCAEPYSPGPRPSIKTSRSL